MAGMFVLRAQAEIKTTVDDGETRTVVSDNNADRIAGGYIYLKGESDEVKRPLSDVWVTDGFSLTQTDENGRYRIVLDEEARWVSFVNPQGTLPTSAMHFMLPGVNETERMSLDFAVKPLPHDPGEPFRFVHHSDLHHSREDHVKRNYNQLVRHVHRIPDRPSFILDSGDLSNDSRERLEWARETFDLYELPTFTPGGNHDQDPNEDYRGQVVEELFHPLYFAFTYDKYLFLNFAWAGFPDDAVAWAEALLEQIGDDYFIAVNQHHWWGLGERYVDLLGILEKYETIGSFNGHYHTNHVMKIGNMQHFMVTKGADAHIRDLAIPSFNIITAYPDGIMVADYRNTGFEFDVKLVHPTRQSPFWYGEQIPILVNAYDTAIDVQQVYVSIHNPDDDSELASVNLKNGGGHAWTDNLTPDPDWPDYVTIRIHVTDERNISWEVPELVVPVKTAESSLAIVQPQVDWGMYQGGPDRSGYRETSITPPLRMAWVHVNRNFGLSAPIVANNRVFTGIMNNKTPNDPIPVALALDAVSGEKLWTHETIGRSFRNTLASDGQTIVGQLDDGYIMALDAETGRHIWEDDYMVLRYNQQKTSPAMGFNQVFLRGSPMIDGDMAFFGLQSAYAGAAKLSTGEFLWYHIPNRGSRSWANASWAKNDKHLFRPSSTGQIIDPETGEAAGNWDAELESNGWWSGPVVSGQRVFFANPVDRPRWAFHAVDTETGELLWQTPIEGRATSHHMSSPAVGPELVYFVFQGAVNAYDKEDGRLVWVTDVLSTTDVSPVVAGEYLYVVSGEESRLHALSAETGEIVWEFDLGIKVSSGMALSGNTLYVTGRNGALYAFVPAPVSR